MMPLQKLPNNLITMTFMKKIIFLFTLSLFLLSCDRSETVTTETSTTGSSTTQTTTTSVKMNVINSNSVPQAGVVVMMFREKVTSQQALPVIVKEATSDANGLAYFDLSTTLNANEEVFYFEAFRKNGNNYTWVSTIHPVLTIKKNTQTTTSIIVKN